MKEKSKETTKAAELPQRVMSKTLTKPEKNISKSNVMITNVNDMQIYDADVIGTYSQSSGTVSYDSLESMNDKSLEKAKASGKYVGLILPKKEAFINMSKLSEKKIHLHTSYSMNDKFK